MTPRPQLLAALLAALACCTPVTDSGQDAGNADAGNPLDAGSTDQRIGPVASCAELSATACFSNLDCSAERRCQDVGELEGEVTCCVPGTRGDRAAGQACDPDQGEQQCESSICIERDGTALCSTTCTQPGDCPTGMQNCMFIAFSDSNDMWCFPE